ncbi:MAG UNVERIFIED_CONTAM: hypothetical protein LVQ98_00825 [Rickettsiaceae bacterium]
MERRKNREYLEDVITKLINAVPKSAVKGEIFREEITIRENLEIIAQNAEKYNIDIYKLLALNLELITQYTNTLDINNVKKLAEWFNKNEYEGKFKLRSMCDQEKSAYASYLVNLAWYSKKCSDNNKALDYYTRALEIYAGVKGFEVEKCHTYFRLALTEYFLRKNCRCRAKYSKYGRNV